MATIIITDIKELVDLKDILSIDSISNQRLIINDNFHKLRRGLFAVIDALGLGTGSTYISNASLPPDIVANSFSTNLGGPPYNFRVDSQGTITGNTITVDRSTTRRINLTADPTILPLGPGEIRWDGTDFFGWTGSAWISFTAGAAGGEVTDAVNVGSGTGIFYQKILNGGLTYELQLKTLVAGSNITITNTTPNEIVISSAGVSGTSGVSGATGTSGFSGYSGKSGYSGPSGYSGTSGATGQSGTSGVSGFSGYSGFSGLNGAASASGYSGYSGKSGYSGFSGYSGPSGYSGYSGESGISGYSGRGLSGFSGYSGTAGAQGFSGYSGYSGGTGTDGTSGYSGYSGKSGYSGFSGYSGQQGSVGLTGADGADGASGYSGKSGFSGTSVSGYSGYSGAGTSGFSGYSGISGISGFSGTATNYVRINYAALLSLQASGTLNAGAFYLIQDLSEPLVVQATEVDSIHVEAKSPTYPQDVIHYDFLNNNIIYRLDTEKRLSAHYDWRTVTFTRWETAIGNGYYILPTNPGGGQASLNGFFTFGNDIKSNVPSAAPASDGSGGTCHDIHIGRSSADFWGTGFDVNNVIFGNACHTSEIMDNSILGTVGNGSYNITTGLNAYNFVIGGGSNNVELINEASNVTIGKNAVDVSAGGFTIVVGDNPSKVLAHGTEITIGNICSDVTIFGEQITLGNNNAGVQIGGSADQGVQQTNSITLGNNNFNVYIEYDVSDVSLGNDCNLITIEHGSYTIYLGNGCQNNAFGPQTAKAENVTVADTGCYVNGSISTFKRTLNLDTALSAGALTIPSTYQHYIGEIILSATASTATISSFVNFNNISDNSGIKPIFRPEAGLVVTWANTAVASASAGQIVTEGTSPYTDGDNNEWIQFERNNTSGVVYKIAGANYV